MEALVVVAVIGTMTAISVPMIREFRTTVKESKLNTEVTTLNKAVRSFVSSGGEVTENDTAAEILEKLKQAVSEDEALSHVGHTGSLVDYRLTGEIIDAETPGLRVVWNFEGYRFEVTRELVEGFGAFELDENATAPTENRDVASPYKYSDEEGWVWEYGEPGVKLTIAPTTISTSPENENPEDPILISLVPPTPPTPPVPGNAPVDPDALDPPVFSIRGGNHPLADYRLQLTIDNPNDGIPSQIFYKVGGSGWNDYEEGTVLEISPSSNIDAFIFSLVPETHNSSTLASAY